MGYRYDFLERLVDTISPLKEHKRLFRTLTGRSSGKSTRWDIRKRGRTGRGPGMSMTGRYYNPVLGRFLQEDTYHGGGLNLYIYCHNNPVMYYDPSGYMLEDSDYPKINYDNAGSGYAYYQNKTHSDAFRNRGSSTGYKGSSFQSHHMLQGQWANDNLAGYDYDRAPTISLGTGYYTDASGNQAVAPHTIANNN